MTNPNLIVLRQTHFIISSHKVNLCSLMKCLPTSTSLKPNLATLGLPTSGSPTSSSREFVNQH